MVARSGVESGLSAMPSDAAAIEAAGCASDPAPDPAAKLVARVLRQKRRRVLDQEVASLRQQPLGEGPANACAFLRVDSGTRMREDQSEEPVAGPPPQLKRDIAAHREAADDCAIHPGGIQRLDTPFGGRGHRHHVTNAGCPAEAGEMRRDDRYAVAERGQLRFPHAGV